MAGKPKPKEAMDESAYMHGIRLVGVTFENRQENLADLYGLYGDGLIPGIATYETYNPMDINALSISVNGKKIGYVPRDSDIGREGPVLVQVHWYKNHRLGATAYWRDEY